MLRNVWNNTKAFVVWMVDTMMLLNIYIDKINTLHITYIQNSLGECFSDLAHKSPELQQEFLFNAEAQRNLTKNGQQLLASLNFFVSSVNTIVNKTMEDSLATVTIFSKYLHEKYFNITKNISGQDV